MANDRNVVGELGLRRVEEGRREQAGKGDENRALPDPPERRGAHVVAGELQRRDADQEGENALQPDHQREDDVDDEALVEEVDRPERRLLHAGNARQRQQKREHAGDRERADGEPGPADELALDRALRAGGGPRAIERGAVVCAVWVMERSARSTGVHRIEVDRHHIDDEAGDRDKEPERQREPGEPLVGREPLPERVVEGHRHEDRDNEGHQHMNREKREIDRPDRAIAAEFRQARERVIDEIDREKSDAEADGDEHRAPVPLAIAGADEAVGAQENDDGRRIDDGEHVRQLANGDHAASTVAAHLVA